MGRGGGVGFVGSEFRCDDMGCHNMLFFSYPYYVAGWFLFYIPMHGGDTVHEQLNIFWVECMDR